MKKDSYLKWKLHLLSLVFFLVKTIQGESIDDALVFSFSDGQNFKSIFEKKKQVIRLSVVNYEYKGNYNDRYG